MERRTQSSRINNANECDLCVLKSHVIYEKRVVFCPCSGYLPCAASRRACYGYGGLQRVVHRQAALS